VTGRRRRLVLAGLAVLATVVVVFLLNEAAHNLQLLSRLRHAAPGWLVLCAAGEVLAYGGFVVSYQAMAGVAGGPWLPFGIVVRVVGLSFGAFSIATAIGGLSVDFWALREAGESPADAGARVIGLETLRWAILALATCVAGVIVLAGVGHGMTPFVPVAWLVVTAACFAGGIWVSAPARRDSLMSGRRRIGRALAVAVRGLVYIRLIMKDGSGLRGRAIGGATLFWVGELVCAGAALRAFGARVAPADLVLGYTTGYLAEGLPLPLGGAGGVDAALAGGFALAGAPLGSAVLGALTFRLFSFWLPALGAVVAAATGRSVPGRLREIARARRLTGDPRAPAAPTAPPEETGRS
jgi:hypothetical protein